MSHDLEFTGADESPSIQLVETWEIAHVPLPAGAEGHPTKRRNLRAVSVILLHQTDVAGGFGVTSRQLATIPESDYGPEQRLLEARQDRYRKTPYHGIYSPQDLASIIQWPAWAYMYHGNGGNARSLGWAYDGKIPGDALDVEGAKESLRHLIQYALDAGCDLKHIEAHRQHSNARGGDPGADIWREIALPVAREFGLTPNSRVTGSGRPIPAAWG